ncbi:MAG: hypothetical protein JWN86_2647 [Planctomycetota bacterium]|nr:hypothetical protein [Planctomycetota bacterium]
MRNDFEILVKLIIPAILLIFWALSNLFNRENTSAQSKSTGAPAGPRPGGFPAPRPSERDRQIGSQAANPVRYVTPVGNDEVLIIRSETSRPPARPNPQPRRNQGRSRGPQNPQNRRIVDPPVPKREQVGGRLSTDVNQTISNTMDLRSLTQSMAAASASTSIGTQTVASSVAEGIQPTMSALDLRQNLTDPLRIRQAFLLNELLQPPVALRGRTGRRR